MKASRAALCGIILGSLLTEQAGAQSTDHPLMAQFGDQEVYLSVRMDGQPTTLIARFRAQAGRLYARGADLAHIGLNIGKLGIRADQEVALDQVPGLKYQYDANQQSVALETADGARTAYRIDARGLPITGAASSGRGLLLNYDVYARTDRDSRLAAWSELRYFDQYGVASNTGVAYFYRDLNRYMRYDTSWAQTNQENMTTLRLGDTVTGALTWSRSVRLGGVQWGRDFATRPDLVTFPMPQLGGTSTVPTAVDVYINSIRRYSGNVPGGPFVVDNVTGITGYGQANVVTRDALGRPVSLSVPIYIDTRLLAQGLSNYSVEAGFVRKQYGWRSFDYDSSPAVSGAYQYGVSDDFTFQAQAQGSTGLANAGAGALYRLGTSGVLSASIAGSAGRHAGAQVGLGYQYVDSRFSVDVSTLRALGDYGDLGSMADTPVTRSQDQFTLSVPVGLRQTVALSYIGVRYPDTDAARIGSVSYTVSPSNTMTLGLSAYKDFARDNTRGVFFTFSMALDKVSASATAGRQNGENYLNATALRTPDYEGGYGWGVQLGQSDSRRFGQAWARYLGRYGEVTAGAENYGDKTIGSLDVNGSLVLMSGTVQPARRIVDSFALVSTDGRGEVPVLRQNVEIGRTNSSGYLVVPDLNSYQENRVDINALDLPANASVDAMTQFVIPQSRSGVVARFGMRQQNAASITLVDAAGKPLPVGAHVTHKESGEISVVGYDGISFFTRLVDDNHFDVRQGEMRCQAELPFRPPADGSLPQLGPVTCRAGAP